MNSFILRAALGLPIVLLGCDNAGFHTLNQIWENSSDSHTDDDLVRLGAEGLIFEASLNAAANQALDPLTTIFSEDAIPHYQQSAITQYRTNNAQEFPEVASGTGPNIIIIVADDMPRGLLGFEGNSIIKTPNLDRLRREGTYFNNFYVPIGQCGPSRSVLWTGLFPTRSGIETNGNVFRNSNTTVLPLWLKQHGYRTGFFGKCHIGTSNPGSLDVDWGFDSIYHAEGDAENRPDIIDLWNSKVHLRKAISPPPVAGSTHYTKLLHDKALEFINRNDSKPFFAWIAHRAPHQQSLIGTNLENQSAAWRRLRPPSEPIYNTAQMPMVLNPAKGNDTLQTKPPQQLGFASRYFYNFVAENIGIKEYHRRAFEQIDYLDKQIGVLVEQLRVANKLDNTLIVFLSDNGVFLGERGMQGKGPFNYDEITRVPLVFWWPGRVPAATRNALVQSTDLIQTLAEAAQTPKVPGTNSSSFWPVVSGSAEDRHRTSVFFQYHSQKNIITQIRGVLKNGWKFSHYLASNSYVNVDGASNTEKVPLVPYSPLSFELYNLNADPNELTNRLPYERGELDALRKATLDPNQRPKINDLLRTMSEYQTISQDPTGVIVTDILVTRTGPETATLTWKSKKGQNPLAASTEVVYRKKDCLSCPTFEIDHKSLSSDHSVNLSGLQQNVAYEAMAFSISATANGGFARVIIPATQGTGWVGGGNPFISYVWQNFNTQVISYQQPPSIETKTCQIFGANGGVIGQWQIGRKYCVDVCRELQNTNPNRSCRWGEDIFHFAESSLCLVPISEPNTREYTSLYQCREKCRAQSPSSTCKWGAFTINP